MKKRGAYILKDTENEQIYKLYYPGITTIGRNPIENAIVLGHKLVSKLHAQIELKGYMVAYDIFVFQIYDYLH